MSTAITPASKGPAATRLRESRELFRLGHKVAAATMARAVIELTIIERLGNLGLETSRQPIKERVRVLGCHSDLTSREKKRIVDAFLALSEYVHGRRTDTARVEGLLVTVEEVATLIRRR